MIMPMATKVRSPNMYLVLAMAAPKETPRNNYKDYIRLDWSGGARKEEEEEEYLGEASNF